MTRLATLFTLLILFAPAAWADDDACAELEAGPIPIVELEANGHAKICVFASRIKAKLWLKNLVPGNAYTVWWVYFDDPASCVHGGPGVCGPADFAGDNPLAVLGRMDSGIAPRSGKLRFNGRWRGMQPTNGSLIQLLVFGHGAADYTDGRRLARQTLTPEDPTTGVPHLGNNIDGPAGYPVALTTLVVE